MMMAIIAMIVVILVGIVLNSIHLTFHLTSLCWFTGECLWVPKRKIKWNYVFCPTGRAKYRVDESSVECFPNSRWKESHLSSNCRRPMIKNKLSAGVIIKKRDVDMSHACKSKHLDNILFWLIWPQKNMFFFILTCPWQCLFWWSQGSSNSSYIVNFFGWKHVLAIEI